MWRLVGIQGAYNGRYFDLTKENLTVGKAPGCDIFLNADDTVADMQAALLYCNGTYVYRDLDPTCTSTVNGVEVNAMATLNADDAVQIGGSVFRVERFRDAAVASAPTPAAVSSPVQPPVVRPFAGAGWDRKYTVPAVVGAIVIVLAGLGVVANHGIQVNKANQHMAQEARDAVASVKAIDSALTVGIAEPEYSKLLVTAQTKVDTFVADCGKDKFDNLAGRLREALRPYADADRLWTWQLTHDAYGAYLAPDNELRKELADRYPSLRAAQEPSGTDPLDGPVMTCSTARQILWNDAGRLAQALTAPKDGGD